MAFYNWFKVTRKEIYTEHDDSLDQLDTAHPPQVALQEGIHHAHLFLATLEQHEAFGEEEYAPITKIMNRMHTALVSSTIQTKISDFFKPVLPSYVDLIVHY